MKKIILKTGIVVVMTILFVPSLFTIKVSAQTEATTNSNEYTLLAPLPCVGSDQDCKNTTTKTELKYYISGAFNLLIGLSAVFAVLMIVIGGFQYMSSDAIQSKSAGKERIKNAILGLVLVIGAWLILYTINPNLLELNLNITAVSTTSSDGMEGGGAVVSSKLNCPTCVSTGPSIAVKSGAGSQLEPNTLNAVNALDSGLDSQGVGWKITEGYPPTVDHQSACHYNGTCFDAALTSPTTENIKRFVETARNNGLSPSYEVTSQAAKDSLIQALSSAGLSNPPVVVNTAATGVHFHVSKP